MTWAVDQSASTKRSQNEENKANKINKPEAKLLRDEKGLFLLLPPVEAGK